MEFTAAPVLFGGIKRVHGRTVIVSKDIHELGRWKIAAKNKRIALESYLFSINPGLHESINHMLLNTPRHRADEASGWIRRAGGTKLQGLCHKRRVLRNPIPHHNVAAWTRNTHHLTCHFNWLGR